MARKLTDEQRAEIVRRYEAGERAFRISKDLGLSWCAVNHCLEVAGKEKRPYRLPLPVPSREQLVELYWQEQMSLTDIARLFATGSSMVLKWLDSHSIDRRAHGDAMRLAVQQGKFVDRRSRRIDPSVSPQRLADMYWRERKTAEEISKIVGVSKPTVLIWLREQGVKVRSSAESARLGWKMGKYQVSPVLLKGNPDALHRWKQEHPDEARKFSQEAAKRAHDSMRGVRRNARAVNCEWCGREMIRPPCHIDTYCYCNRQCKGKTQTWRSLHQGEPRPLIVERLRSLMVHPNGIRIANPTYEQLEKAGAAIGAREPEIEAVLLEGR